MAINSSSQFEFDGFVFVSKQGDRVSSSTGNIFQPNKLLVINALDYTNITSQNSIFKQNICGQSLRLK